MAEGPAPEDDDNDLGLVGRASIAALHGALRSSFVEHLEQNRAEAGVLLTGREIGEDMSFFLAAASALPLFANTSLSYTNVLGALAISLVLEHGLSTAGLTYLLREAVRVPTAHAPLQRALGVALGLATYVRVMKAAEYAGH